MELLNHLKDHQIVVKFQQVCGVERLPVTDSVEQSEYFDTPNLFSDSNLPNGDTYVKRRHKYVLKESAFIETSNESKQRNENDFDCQQGEGISHSPPFGSDDSDVDNSRTNSLSRAKPTPHRINNSFLYWAFKIASFFGDEAFYLTFYPFCVWNFDSYVVRHTVYVWSIAMYFGQAGKDIFQWSRPTSPPVVRLETDFAQEFAMPSTHAVAGSVIPLLMGYTIMYRYQIPTAVVVTVATIWCVMVCLSRLYLGVHSVLDLLAGILLTLITALCMVPFIEQIDWFVQTNPVSPIVLVSLCLALSTIFYPAPDIGSTTRGDTIQVITCSVGCFLGCWMNYYHGFSQVVEPSELFVFQQLSLKFIATAILRFIIGALVVLLLKIMIKTGIVKIVSAAIGLHKADKHHPTVEKVSKFITYMSVGLIITWTVPILLMKMGLGRPAYYQEIL